MANAWLTFSFDLPLVYKPYQKAYPFDQLLLEVIKVLTTTDVTPQQVQEKYIHFGRLALLYR